MKHAAGPHDITLAKTVKKGTVTSKSIKNALKAMQGMEIGPDTFGNIEQFVRDNTEPLVTERLKLKKLAVEDSSGRTEVE
jgi:hypothetical protein